MKHIRVLLFAMVLRAFLPVEARAANSISFDANQPTSPAGKSVLLEVSPWTRDGESLGSSCTPDSRQEDRVGRRIVPQT